MDGIIKKSLHFVEHKTPHLVYDLSLLKRRMSFLRDLSVGKKVKFLFAVKSFPYREVLELASEFLFGFEVSNLNELRLLPERKNYLSINDPTSRILSNTSNILELNIPCCINLDFFPEDRVKDLAYHPNLEYGLRVSHTSFRSAKNFPTGVPKSRFGVDLLRSSNLSRYFKPNFFKGFHVHNGSEQNTLNGYLHIIDEILHFTEEHDIALKYINLGGGLHRLSENEITSLVEQINDRLLKRDSFCLFEPGYFVAKHTGYAVTQVVSVKQFAKKGYFIFVDISQACHLKWSEPEILLSQKSDNDSADSGEIKVFIGGPTCFEMDRVGFLKLKHISQLPKEGDFLYLKNVNGYSAAWNTSFNGIEKANISFLED